MAPLFETREDLINAPKVVDAALGLPWYKNHVQGKQEAKGGGREVSAWRWLLVVGQKPLDPTTLLLVVVVGWLAWLGLAWLGLAWLGLAWLG